VYCGVHYPTDVVAGAVLGAAVGVAAYAALRALRPESYRRNVRGHA
jgi:membrane-associated phospholipid phosphatase